MHFQKRKTFNLNIMNVKQISEVNEIVAGDATILKEIFHPSNEDIPINYSLAHAKIEPGKSSIAHTLQCSETYYILDGEGIIYLDEEEVILKKDTVVLVPGGVIQYVENTGKSDLVFLCICDPPWTSRQELVLNDLL